MSATRSLPVLERGARLLWLQYATHVHYGRCDDCDRVRDDDGTALLVARQPRCKRFQCLACFDQNPTGPAARR